MNSPAVASTPSAPQTQPNPLPRKYDGRALSPQQRSARERWKNTPRKPRKRKQLHNSGVSSILRDLNDKDSWTELYRASFTANDLRLCFQILCYLTDRRDGRPFVAENPNARAATRTPDPNLVIAVNNLTVNNTGKSKKKQTVIDSQAISTQSAGDLPQLSAADSGAVPALEQPIQAAKNPGDGQ